MKKNNYIWFILQLMILVLPLTAHAQVLFETGQSLGAPGSVFEVVAVGDIDNNGREDIVTATGFYFSPQFDYQLLVYSQSESGTFPTTLYYPYSNVYPGIKAIAVNDANNDALNDVIIGYGDSIGIFFQNTSGALNPMVSYYSGTSVDDIKVADVNNDGREDIVVCHWNDNFIRVFYQTPTAFTTNIYAKPQGGYDEIEIGDMDSDGLNDVVYMAGQGIGGIHVFKQNSGGTLNNYISYFPGGGGFQALNSIAIGDLNQDGANDLLASKGGNRPDASLVIWYQDTLTHLLKPIVSTAAYEIPSAIEVADFNCDGKPEIFINHGGWNAVTVWSDSSGYYTNYDIYQVSVAQHPQPEALTSGDINSDGKLDIVTVGDFTSIQLLYNISIPTSFTNIDTTIVIDSVLTQHNESTYYFTTTQIDTISNFVIILTDSLQVMYTYSQFNVKTDSIYSRTGVLCSSEYNDVITDSYNAFFATEIRDTSFLSSTLDTVQLVGISEPIADDIKISPNPFYTELTFQNAANEPTIVAIYDFLSRQILLQTFTNSTTINTAQLADGIYFYELKNAKRTLKTGKLVKQ